MPRSRVSCNERHCGGDGVNAAAAAGGAESLPVQVAPGGAGVGHHMHVVAALDQVHGRLQDTGVRLDAAQDDGADLPTGADRHLPNWDGTRPAAQLERLGLPIM